MLLDFAFVKELLNKTLYSHFILTICKNNKKSDKKKRCFQRDSLF